MTGRTTTNQKGANAGGSIVGGDQINSSVHHHYAPAAASSVVGKLLEKLHAELSENPKMAPMIDELRCYYQHTPSDGVTGLQAKLEKGNRAHELEFAMDRKERFVKLLDKWSMYATAQEIFAFLLARAEVEYTNSILPQIGVLSEVEVNVAIQHRIVEPAVLDCGASVFKLNHGAASGMIYWLAEQCFVRWHK